MKIKIVSKTDEKITFVLSGATPAFANALRRIMVSEVPTMAIEWVDFYENNSVFFDEMIAHRLGLIPLRFDPDKFNFTDECVCNGKGCPSCQVVFVIDKTGPCMVYSGDMKSSNKDVQPIDPGFPIVELFPGQKLKLEAVAVLGRGKEHAKWQAANAAYQYYPVLKTKDVKNPEKIKKKCPKGILSVKAGKLVLDDPIKCDLCRACAEQSEGVEIEGDPTRFIFRVETVSGLKPEEIVSKAAEILGKKAEEFKKELKKL
ncbi:MAG: DNA-directed RNA polymerase subunit D [Candidatus Aenigmatarchaeota archaeon]|nr:MAG: DNA-directed RNA polymerase subunit D [Candidatus Aenigmarchaeota archaeon]